MSVTAVYNGVVGGGWFDGTWNGVTSEDRDFAVVKLSSAGVIAWRLQVSSDALGI